MAFVRMLGEFGIKGVLRIGRMGIFLGRTFFFSLTPPIKFSLVLKQIEFIGFSPFR
jgi:hypothetical protein